MGLDAPEVLDGGSPQTERQEPVLIQTFLAQPLRGSVKATAAVLDCAKTAAGSTTEAAYQFDFRGRPVARSDPGAQSK
jgi:hypothetical protein